MPSFIDLYLLEKDLASRSTSNLKNALKSSISSTTISRTGLALRTAGSRSVFKEERLQRITIRAPHYIFKNNFGFEGTKKNGVVMRLKATGVINMALEKSNVLDTLADGISEIRLSQVTSKINFSKDGR
jgi:hypothetical protein